MQTVARFMSSATRSSLPPRHAAPIWPAGTLDIWPLYLFHPGAVSVNVAFNILTRCRITPRRGREIVLRSHDTGRHERFAGLDELLAAKTYRASIGGPSGALFQADAGFMLETYSESPAGAGISGSSALMIATTAALARFVGRD